MPELPDIVAYQEALDRVVGGHELSGFRMPGFFLLRTVDPKPESAVGRRLGPVDRLGKRLVLPFEGGPVFVLHLMVAGRLRWKKAGVAIPRKAGLAALDFPHGSLLLTEQGSKRMAALHVVAERDEARALDPGGLDLADASLEAFRDALCGANHTLKRRLTDPRVFAGIGNAFSDEILHDARLSPLTWTTRLEPEEIARLHASCQQVLARWIERRRDEVGSGFPDKVTAFHPAMAVHGRFKQPCPRCDAPIQRIRHASNEINYCAPCQTEGQVYADRSLSRLLKGDWPRTIEAWESLSGESGRK